MEKITYVLGAGFSAPLGIPVMRDFLTKSKDLYFPTQRVTYISNRYLISSATFLLQKTISTLIYLT